MWVCCFTAEDKDDEIGSWAIKACQRCLIFLGDIGKKLFKNLRIIIFFLVMHSGFSSILIWSITARYQSDLEGKEAIKLAERFYSEAALINPDIGKCNSLYLAVKFRLSFVIRTHSIFKSSLWIQ